MEASQCVTDEELSRLNNQIRRRVSGDLRHAEPVTLSEAWVCDAAVAWASAAAWGVAVAWGAVASEWP